MIETRRKKFHLITVSKLKKFNLEDYFEKKIKRWNYSMGRITNTKRTQTMKQNIEIDDTLK